MEMMLESIVAFRKEYNKKIAKVGILDIWKQLLGSYLMRDMRTKSGYQNNRVTKIVLNNDFVSPLVERLRIEVWVSKSPDTS